MGIDVKVECGSGDLRTSTVELHLRLIEFLQGWSVSDFVHQNGEVLPTMMSALCAFYLGGALSHCGDSLRKAKRNAFDGTNGAHDSDRENILDPYTARAHDLNIVLRLSQFNHYV